LDCFLVTKLVQRRGSVLYAVDEGRQDVFIEMRCLKVLDLKLLDHACCGFRVTSNDMLISRCV
jgi:hypothetical protein